MLFWNERKIPTSQIIARSRGATNQTYARSSSRTHLEGLRAPQRFAALQETKDFVASEPTQQREVEFTHFGVAGLTGRGVF